MGRTGTKWGTGGNGKVGGAARDSRLPPYFTRLPFFSCCESKLAHLSAESRLKLGMMMMMTMIMMVTVVVVMVVTVVSIVNVFIIIIFNDSCVSQLPRSTLKIP